MSPEGLTPIPDPTLLTTQQLEREIAHLKELFASRLAEMDKAVQLLQMSANRSPTINEVFLQHEERFKSIVTQFAERDTRAAESIAQSKTAVDAALQAAKEAFGQSQQASDRSIAKSEASITKQIDQIGEIMAQGTKASDEKIDDLKERLASLDGRRGGVGDVWGFIVGGLGLAVAIVALLLSRENKEPQIIYAPPAQASKP
jgi:hypothetical protein